VLLKPERVEPIRIARIRPVRMTPAELGAEALIERNASPFLRVTDDPAITNLERAPKEVGFEDLPRPRPSHSDTIVVE
jgi:hypothetical protein